MRTSKENDLFFIFIIYCLIILSISETILKTGDSFPVERRVLCEDFYMIKIGNIEY